MDYNDLSSNEDHVKENKLLQPKNEEKVLGIAWDHKNDELRFKV